MCLCVDTKKHFNGKPKIADTDILVYKMLTLNDEGEIVTPYQRYLIIFDENGTFTYSKVRLKKIGNSEITKGIHSFLSEIGAWLLRYHEFDRSIHYAIIPKGSRYFIGVVGDIVSNNLIVFENKEVYKKYKSTHKVTIIK